MIARANLCGLIAAAACLAFQQNPALKALGDTTWLQVQPSYGCGSDLCEQTLDYSGMTYDFHRHKILMFGGGHATQLWNQVEEFDFATLSWKQLYAPDSCSFYLDPAHGYGDGGTRRADGSVYPISRHTYDGLDMLTDTCLMIMSTTQEGKGGTCISESQWTGSAYFHDDYVWLFDPIRIKWTRQSKTAFTYGSGNAVDPETDLLYGQNGQGDQTWVYDYRTQVRTEVASSGPNWIGFCSMTYYPVTKTYFYFGTDNIYEFNPRTAVWTTKNPSGAQVSCYTHNVPYDSKNNIFGIFNNSTFYYYSPTTNTWYARPYGSAYPASPTFHHTIYDPIDNVYINVVQSGYNGWSTCAYKLSDTPGKYPGTQSVSVAANRSRKRQQPAVSVYFDPYLNKTKISLPEPGMISIYNLSGRLVEEWGKRTTVIWNPKNCPTGAYVLRIAINGVKYEKKIVKTR